MSRAVYGVDMDPHPVGVFAESQDRHQHERLRLTQGIVSPRGLAFRLGRPNEDQVRAGDAESS